MRCRRWCFGPKIFRQIVVWSNVPSSVGDLFRKLKITKWFGGSNHIIFPGSLKHNQISRGQYRSCSSATAPFSNDADYPMTHVCEDIRLLNVKTLWKSNRESFSGHLMPLNYRLNALRSLTFFQPQAVVETVPVFFFVTQRLSQLNTFHSDFWAEKKSFCLWVLPPVLLLGDTGSLLWLAGWSVNLFVSVLLEGLWDFLFLMRILPISSWGLGRGTPDSSCKYTQQKKNKNKISLAAVWSQHTHTHTL